ncbi:hypothetical protein K1719_027656 [Acacia pycnantha]|nr:hypothetical protein K1719_027656 [Acacia pycnantha]
MVMKQALGKVESFVSTLNRHGTFPGIVASRASIFNFNQSIYSPLSQFSATFIYSLPNLHLAHFVSSSQFVFIAQYASQLLPRFRHFSEISISLCFSSSSSSLWLKFLIPIHSSSSSLLRCS